MIDVIELPEGTTCDECGAVVLGKERIPGEVDTSTGFRRVAPAKYGANVPCGHDARATWRDDQGGTESNG